MFPGCSDSSGEGAVKVIPAFVARAESSRISASFSIAPASELNANATAGPAVFVRSCLSSAGIVYVDLPPPAVRGSGSCSTPVVTGPATPDRPVLGS
jgi:hypothetical protein